MMKERKNRLGWVLLLAALAGGGWYWQAHRNGADKTAASAGAVPVKVAAAARRDVKLEIREVGSVAAYETVAVRSRLDSQVVEVKFHDGDAVKKGDLLFVLDDRVLKAQLGQLEANLQRDRAQLMNLQLQYDRTRQLAAKGFQSQASLDSARAALAAQQAAAGATEAGIESLRVQLDYTRILAPIGGRTGTINVTAGNTVKANDAQPLVTINQLQPIRVQASLSQSYFDAVRSAMAAGPVTVAARRESGQESTDGVLEYLDNNVDRATGTFAVRARFANADEGLWPGMFVTLKLNLGAQTQALVIPEVAVQRGQAGEYVFVIADGKAARRDIKIQRLQEGLAVIGDGLKEGEQVAVDGMMSLKDGAAVTLPSPEAKP